MPKGYYNSNIKFLEGPAYKSTWEAGRLNEKIR